MMMEEKQKLHSERCFKNYMKTTPLESSNMLELYKLDYYYYYYYILT